MLNENEIQSLLNEVRILILRGNDQEEMQQRYKDLLSFIRHYETAGWTIRCYTCDYEQPCFASQNPLTLIEPGPELNWERHEV